MTRILIVDDQEENRYLLKVILAAEDYVIDEAREGAEALEKGRQNPPDLVISDLLMPQMDGYTLLRHWKADERLKQVPFIVFTATYTDPDDARLAMSLGADAFILKPCEPEELLARLREVQANATATVPMPPRVPADNEAELLTLYNQALVRKLEERSQRLEEVNRALEEQLREREAVASEGRRAAAVQMAILDALPAHIALVDHDGVILSVNEAWRRFGEANALHFTDFCVGQNYLQSSEATTGDGAEEAGTTAAGLRRVLQGELDQFVTEFPCHSPTERRWFRFVASPVHLATGLGAVVMRFDVTKLKEAEQATLRNLDRLTEAQRIGRIGDWEWDIASDVVTWSPQVFEILGLDPAAASPIDFMVQRQLYEPESQKRQEEMVGRAISTGEPQSYELTAIRPDGERIQVRGKAVPRKNAHGEVTGLYGTIRDITEEKRAEMVLRESEERFRSLLQGVSSVAVQSYEFDTTTRYWNRASEEIYGYTAEEAIGQSLLDLIIPPEMHDGVRAAIRQMERTGKPIPAGELSLMRKDGSRVTVFSSHAVVRVEGRVPEFFCIDIDLTKRKQAELEIARTNRALQLLSGCNEILTRVEKEAELLGQICRIAVETGGYRMAWVGYVREEPPQWVEPMAHAGVEEGYLDEVKITCGANDPAGQGPVGRCIRACQTTVSEDFATDPGFAPWREPARRRGYRSLICLPLHERGRSFGLLALYSGEVNRPTAEELKLLTNMADDLAFGIINLRLRLERERTQEAVLTMARGTSARTGAGFFRQLTSSMIEALGACAGHIGQLDPAAPDTVRTLCAIADGETMPEFSYPAQSEALEGDDVWVTARDAGETAPPLAGRGIRAQAGARLTNATGDAIGVLSVAFREPPERFDFTTSTLKIFAARAASELERLRIDARTREQAALLDKARDAIIVRNFEGRIRYWNKSAERLFGWSAEEAVGQRIQDLLKEGGEAFAEAERVVHQRGEWTGEIQQPAKDGTIRILDSRWTLVRETEGEPHSILEIDTDITERKKIEQQFRRAQRMESIGTLAGGIAHDLNNVLTPIMISIDLLKLGEKDPNRTQILTAIEGSAKRGAAMVQQVLSFARGVEGRRVEVEVGQLLRDIEKIVNETFLKHIAVQTRIPSFLWTVAGDPTQLHQVMLNLCVNARDAMPDGGNLLLAAENRMIDEPFASQDADAAPGPHVVLTVEDSGTGMSPEVIEKIFDPFFTTKELGRGTGLGLSTSLAIVKSHGGFVRVYSEPGRGSKFRVYLPARTESVPLPAEPILPDTPGGQGELVLVVDDEEAVRKITKMTLEAFGYQALLACNGTEAVALFSERHDEIAVVLTDMMMPEMDGPTLITVLRKIDPGVDIIAASGLAAKEQISRAAAQGVRHFLPKPFTAEVLLQTLRLVLRPGGDAAPLARA